MIGSFVVRLAKRVLSLLSLRAKIKASAYISAEEWGLCLVRV